MVEHIPLARYLADAAMGVAGYGRRSDYIARLIYLTATGIYDRTAIGPWTKRRIAVGICKRIVGRRQSEFAFVCPAALYEYVFILDLADR